MKNLDQITATCDFLGNSEAVGIQMLVQQRNLAEVHKLYTSKTTDLQTPASVEVEENGEYLVAIFAIRGERGIVNSEAIYTGVPGAAVINSKFVWRQ